MVSEKPDDKEHGIVFIIGFFFLQKHCYSETMFLKGLTEKKPQFIVNQARIPHPTKSLNRKFNNYH